MTYGTERGKRLFQDLYKVLRAAFKFLFDRKNNRFTLYQKMVAGLQQRVIIPSLFETLSLPLPLLPLPPSVKITINISANRDRSD